MEQCRGDGASRAGFLLLLTGNGNMESEMKKTKENLMGVQGSVK